MVNRDDCYRFLNGNGLEIGALHEPAKLSANCHVEYFDLRTKQSSAELFDELDSNLIVEPDYIGDVDKRDLRRLGSDRFDFVVAAHVIEHLANPLAFLDDCFFILKPRGVLAISVPDKRFTFDRNRTITSARHILDDYRNRVTLSDDSHYLDFIRNVLPNGAHLHGAPLQTMINLVKQRREHVHVWDSESFAEFVRLGLSFLGQKVEFLHEICGDETKFEYRAAIRKLKKPSFLNRLRGKMLLRAKLRESRV